MSFIYNMADTWNAVGTTFNGIYMNISNGAGGAPVGAAASRAFRLDSNGSSIFDISISGQVNLNSVAGLFWSTDLSLYRDAANTLALHNSTNAQKMRWYQSFTNASNGAWGEVDLNTANTLIFGSNGNGTGASTLSKLQFNVLGVNKLDYGVTVAGEWAFGGTVRFAADNTYNIGAAGGGRPQNIYVAGTLTVDFLSGASGIAATIRGTEKYAFGGTTSASPMLKKSSTALQARLGDDSDFTQIAAAFFNTAKAYTVAALPAGTVGFIARVTDALAPAVGTTVANGGSAAALVWYNGANYTVIGV